MFCSKTVENINITEENSNFYGRKLFPKCTIRCLLRAPSEEMI